ncbi:hypothetical protein BX283_0960 [Streptomyces sp. TLI_146]|nr:hypothetical protein BX283_0960 [Streptomyces sp. TLI_146]
MVWILLPLLVLILLGLVLILLGFGFTMQILWLGRRRPPRLVDRQLHHGWTRRPTVQPQPPVVREGKP